jgi:integrase
MDGLAPSERPPQKTAREVEALTVDQIARLVGAASSERWRAALGLAGFAGMRLGEVRALRWRDVDLAAGRIAVNASMGRDGKPGPPKTKAGYRVVPLVPALRRLLVAWKLRAPHTRPDDLVIGTADGGAVQERNIRRALDAAKESAGLDETEGRLSMHSLRHSWVSAMATGGLAATTLARLAGHSDAGFTLRVYASDPRDDAAVAESVLTLAADAGFGVSQEISQVLLSPAGASRQRVERRRAQRCGFDRFCRLGSARASSLTSRRSRVRATHRPLSRFPCKPR